MDIICDDKKCYGCGLCANLCPVNAISMKESVRTGHFSPIINEKICIDCQKCKKQCPANNSPKFHPTIETYAAWRSDPKKQIGSSSGGVAAAFYEAAYQKGWKAVGAVLDGKDRVLLYVSENPDIIEKFKGSKYVQADTKKVFAIIADETAKGNHILFIGSPCQCEAARIAAGKYNQNLLTVDLVCHGVPSQRVLRDYISWVSAQKGEKVDSISFRSEWGEEMQMFSGDKKIWDRRMYWDYYLELFNYGYINNDACFQCVYAGRNRASDITIGDFWGIGKNEPFSSPKCHVSLIGVNTDKGQVFINDCKELILVKRDWEEAVAGNSQLQKPLKRSNQYDLFWDTYCEKGFNDALHVTVYDKVTERYKKEYPRFYIKDKIKTAIKTAIRKKD